MDKLDEIYKKQYDLQQKLNTATFTQHYKTIMSIAIIDEVMESLRETPWKPWKINQKLNEEKYKQELIDVLHFYLNLCISINMKPNEIYKRYMKKNKINIKRKNGGY